MAQLIDVMIENREKYKRLYDINSEVIKQRYINEKLIEEVDEIYTTVFKNCCNKSVFLDGDGRRAYGLIKNGIAKKGWHNRVRLNISYLAGRILDNDWIRDVYPKLKELILLNVKSNRKELIGKFLGYIPLLQLDWYNNIDIRKELIEEKTIKKIDNNWEHIDIIKISKITLHIYDNLIKIDIGNVVAFPLKLIGIENLIIIEQIYDEVIELAEQALIEQRQFIKTQTDIVERMKKEFEPIMAILAIN